MTSTDWRAGSAGAPGVSAVDDDLSTWRNMGKWTAAFAFFVALLLLAIVLQLFQMTAEGNAKLTLRRSMAALTEVDALLARDYGPMQERAADAEPGDPIVLRDYPIDIGLTVADVRGVSLDGVRDLVLARSADMLYADGTGVLLDEASSGSEVGTFTAAGMIERWLDVMREDRHDALAILTFVLAAACALAAATFVALCRGFGRLVGLGAVVLLVAAPMTLFALLSRWFMRMGSGDNDEYVQRELLRIGIDLAWIPIRNGLALTVFGAGLLVAGVVLARVVDRRRSGAL